MFEKLTDGAMRNPQAITLDAGLTLKLSFIKKSELYFKIKFSSVTFAPTLMLRIKWLRLEAKARIVYDLYHGKLRIGFIDEPALKWAIELRVGMLHLPDWLEDNLPAWLVGKILKRYTPASPLEIDLDLVDILSAVLAHEPGPLWILRSALNAS